jgi:hypothetical protein
VLLILLGSSALPVGLRLEIFPNPLAHLQFPVKIIGSLLLYLAAHKQDDHGRYAAYERVDDFAGCHFVVKPEAA